MSIARHMLHGCRTSGPDTALQNSWKKESWCHPQLSMRRGTLAKLVMTNNSVAAHQQVPSARRFSFKSGRCSRHRPKLRSVFCYIRTPPKYVRHGFDMCSATIPNLAVVDRLAEWEGIRPGLPRVWTTWPELDQIGGDLGRIRLALGEVWLASTKFEGDVVRIWPGMASTHLGRRRQNSPQVRPVRGEFD